MSSTRPPPSRLRLPMSIDELCPAAVKGVVLLAWIVEIQAGERKGFSKKIVRGLVKIPLGSGKKFRAGFERILEVPGGCRNGFA